MVMGMAAGHDPRTQDRCGEVEKRAKLVRWTEGVCNSCRALLWGSTRKDTSFIVRRKRFSTHQRLRIRAKTLLRNPSQEFCPHPRFT